MPKRITPRTGSALKSWDPSEGKLSRTIAILLVLAFAALLGPTCAWAQDQATTGATGPGGPTTASESLADYKLGPGDVIEIAVYQQPDLTRTVTVTGDGKIFFPPLMEFSVSGMTADDLDRFVTEALQKKYIKDPEVFVAIREYNSHEVLVLGRVPRPGLQKLKGTTHLLSLLSQVGGVTIDDVGDRLVILRADPQGGADAAEQEIVIDLRKLLVEGDLRQNVEIRAGDRIFISSKEESSSVYVTGQVKTPGKYPYRTDLKAFDAVMAAGGPTEDASMSRVRIKRGEETLRVNLTAFTRKGKTDENVPLEPGDLVIVPTGLF